MRGSKDSNPDEACLPDYTAKLLVGSVHGSSITSSNLLSNQRAGRVGGSIFDRRAGRAGPPPPCGGAGCPPPPCGGAVLLTEYTECWPGPLFDILLNKYFPAG